MTVATALPALPAELRAAAPAETRGVARDQVRLLVVDRGRGTVEHSRFDRLVEHFGEGDVLVVNTSRTLPAGVLAERAARGAVQVRPCVRRRDSWDALIVQPGPPFETVPLSVGERLRIGGAEATVVGRRTDIPFLWNLRFDAEPGLRPILEAGEPIRYSYVPSQVSLDHYQTVYAAHPGSSEAPSAGRPFTWRLLRELLRQGVELAEIVLHAGLSSFQDDDFDAEHHLFEEWFQVPDLTARAVNRAKRVVAVGTTVVRALESAASDSGALEARTGWTTLAVGPEHPPRVVDALITGLHEPQASHFDLLSAFLPEPLLSRAYGVAVERRYLWHEFGDSLLIV